MSKPASAASGENRKRNMRGKSKGEAKEGATKRLAPTGSASAEIPSTNWLQCIIIISAPTDSPRLQLRRPATGVFIFRGQPTFVFLTVGTERRGRWLADRAVADDLVASWQLADAWMVGRYVLMRNHLHFFCTPVDEYFTIESWITFWKRTFKRLHGNAERRFQAGGFHHRLRGEESYDERWDYVRDNPVQRLKYLPPAAGCEISR
jgi:putative transposase